MTIRKLKFELKKYLTEKEFLNQTSKKINQLLLFDNISKLPYNVIKDVDSVIPLSWWWISEYQKLSEDFIREFQDKVEWDYISGYQKLSEDFIREFKDKINWHWISSNQKLSEDFIREFKDRVNWNLISRYQKLSEDFIREFKDKVDWVYISWCQKLSEDFILENLSKINIENILCNKNIEKPFKNDALKYYMELNYGKK
jgi:hypothetical protein